MVYPQKGSVENCKSIFGGASVPQDSTCEISWQHDLQCMAGLQKCNLTQNRLVVPCFTNPRGMRLVEMFVKDRPKDDAKHRERDPSVCLLWGSSNKVSVRSAIEVICEARNVVRMVRSESEWEQLLKKKLMEPLATPNNNSIIHLWIEICAVLCQDAKTAPGGSLDKMGDIGRWRLSLQIVGQLASAFLKMSADYDRFCWQRLKGKTWKKLLGKSAGRRVTSKKTQLRSS